MNAGMLRNPRNTNDDNDMRFDFINEGTNVNIIERYKYKLSMPHITIPPETRGSSFGLHELEEGSRFGDTEYIEMIPLFMMITRSVIENEDSIYNLLTCP